MYDTVRDSLYTFFYAVIDHKALSFIVFFTFIWVSWGSYTYLPQVVPFLQEDTPVLENQEVPSETNSFSQEENTDIVNEDVSINMPWNEPRENTQTPDTISQEEEKEIWFFSKITGIFWWNSWKNSVVQNNTPSKTDDSQNVQNTTEESIDTAQNIENIENIENYEIYEIDD